MTKCRAQWLEANLKNLELVMYIYKASGVATLLDIRRSCRYHHREVSGVNLSVTFPSCNMCMHSCIEKSVHYLRSLWIPCAFRKDGVEFLAPFLNSISTRAALKVEKGSSAWVSNRNTVKKAMAAVSPPFLTNFCGHQNLTQFFTLPNDSKYLSFSF